MIKCMALAAALALPGLAAAEQASPMQLHIEARGEVQPDMAVVVREAEAQGSDAASAEAARNAKVADVVRRLHEAGVPAADIATHPGPATSSPVPVMPLPPQVPAPGSTSQPGYTATAVVMVTVHDFGKLAGVQTLLEQALAPYLNIRQVNYRHADPAAAHRLAVERAIAQAAREAEIYAATLHVRLGRLVRVSSVKPSFDMADMIRSFARTDLRPGNGDAALGAETVGVALDYELLP